MHKKNWLIGFIFISTLLPPAAHLHASKNDENLEALIEVLLIGSSAEAFSQSIVKTAIKKHQPNLTADELKKFKKKVIEIIDRRMRDSNGYMDQLKAIYSEVYTEKEITEALVFFKTTTGKKFIQSEEYIVREIQKSSPIWTETLLKDIDNEIESALKSSKNPAE